MPEARVYLHGTSTGVDMWMRSVCRTAVLLTLILVLAKAEKLGAQIQIVEHGPFSAMLDRFAAQNRDPSRRLEGYRVQLLATTDRLKLEDTQRKFESAFPEFTTDWAHEPPYYKLRTGAFTERARATSFLAQIKRAYPGAYVAVVRDIQTIELLDFR